MKWWSHWQKHVPSAISFRGCQTPPVLHGKRVSMPKKCTPVDHAFNVDPAYDVPWQIFNASLIRAVGVVFSSSSWIYHSVSRRPHHNCWPTRPSHDPSKQGFESGPDFPTHFCWIVYFPMKARLRFILSSCSAPWWPAFCELSTFLFYGLLVWLPKTLTALQRATLTSKYCNVSRADKISDSSVSVLHFIRKIKSCSRFLTCMLFFIVCDLHG